MINRSLPPWLLECVRCPRCAGRLERRQGEQVCVCSDCGDVTPILPGGILDLRAQGEPQPSEIQEVRAVLEMARSGTSLAAIVAQGVERGLNEGSIVDELSQRYLNTFERGPERERQRFDLLAKAVVQTSVASMPAGRAIDLGTGSGPGLPILASAFEQVVGLDLSVCQLAYARIRLEEAGVPGDRVGLVAGDVQDLPFPDETFDLVGASNVIEHVPVGQGAFLSEAARVQAKHGVTFFSSPNRFTLGKEEHVCLRWVGFLPRKLQAPYVRLRNRRSQGYESVRLLSYFELSRLLKSTYDQWSIIAYLDRIRMMETTPTTWAAKVAFLCSRLRLTEVLFRWFERLFYKSFEVVAYK